VFFGGPPNRILRAWRDRVFRFVVSPEILEEYQRVGEELRLKYRGVDLGPMLYLVSLHSEIVDAPPLEEQVVTDAADAKFLACALSGRVKTIISGDKGLLRVSGWRQITVVSPRAFVDANLRDSGR